jgi:hypothetical protein
VTEESEPLEAITLMANYRHSAQINDLADSVAKAQSQVEGAKKDSQNPHLKSKYADLASVWDACRKALTDNGLSVLQPVSANGSKVTVTTLLMHKSGQWISSDLELTAVQNTPQGIGSAITYGRRYGLSAMVGIAPEDDDGHAASGGGSREAAQAVAQQKIAQFRSQQISDDDVPANMGGTFTPEPPAVDRVAQAKERAKPSKVPSFADMMAVFTQLKTDFQFFGAEHEYYEILGNHHFEHANDAVKAGVSKAREVKTDMQLRLDLLRSTQGVTTNA